MILVRECLHVERQKARMGYVILVIFRTENGERER